MRISWLSILLPLMANADYEADLKKVNAMGDRADAILTKFGFSSNGEAGHISKESVSSKKQMFQVHDSLSRSKVGAGSLAYGKLLTRLVVGSEESPAIVVLDEAKIGWLKGLRLIGKARQSSSPGRVTIEFDRIILSSGKTSYLQAVGLDSSGALGLSADIFSAKAMMVAGSMVGSFISGYASGQQTTSTTPFGFSQTQPSGRNSLLQGAAQTAADQSKRLIEEATEEKPVLVVNPGAQVSVLFKEELTL